MSAIAATAVIAAAVVVIAETVAIVVTEAPLASATKRRATPPEPSREIGNTRNGTPILPPPQELPLLREGRSPDRLQGRPSAPGLRVRAWQDRPQPHHRGVRQEAA